MFNEFNLSFKLLMVRYISDYNLQKPLNIATSSLCAYFVNDNI